MIRSDHQPLYHLLNKVKAIPPMASAYLQRWALAYKYTFEYKPGKELANADALSRLPHPSTTSLAKLLGELIQLINFISCTPVTAHNIKTWTDKDPILSKVQRYVLSGWPTTNTDPSLQSYWSRRTELSVLDNCIILWCSHLVGPPPARRPLLEQLHESPHDEVLLADIFCGHQWTLTLKILSSNGLLVNLFVHTLHLLLSILGTFHSFLGADSTLILPDRFWVTCTLY